MSKSHFREILEKELVPHLDRSKPLIILGDFNLDIFGKDASFIKELCVKFECKMLQNGPTTDHNATLDLVLSNVIGVAGAIETYWSDHKIVCFHTKLKNHSV